MLGLSGYAGFIAFAYGVSALVLGGLFVWIVRDHRTQCALLAELEARGVRRRSRRGGEGGMS